MIQLTANTVRYNGNDTTTSFDYTFRIFSETDLLVYVDGVLKTLGADYNLTGVNLDEGGSVDFFVAPPTGTNNILFERAVPYTQTISIPEGSKFPARLVETGMDRIVVMLHQLFDKSIRGITLASTAATGTENLEINQNSTERADRVVAFSPDGNSVTVGPTVTSIVSLAVNAATLTLPASSLAGRGSADGTGAVQTITLGNGLAMNGTVLEAGSGQPVVDTASRFEGYTVGLALDAGPIVERANPDSMILRDCQYLVTDKGSIVTPRKGLSLDFATVGAGGRDRADDGTTGHRWWDIYHIFKSTDNPTVPTEDALLLSPSLVRQQTAAFVNASDSTHFVRQATASTRAGQSFLTTVALTELHSVVLRVAKNGTPSGNIWVTIEADASGAPSGTPLATSVLKNPTRFSGTFQYVPFVFKGTNRIALSNATTYWIVVRGDWTIDGSNYVLWGRVTAGGYAGGAALLFNGSTWSGVGADAQFSVQGIPADTTVTMPTGYTEKTLLGFVRTVANGAEFVSCSIRDREYTDRSVASASERVLANPTDTVAGWYSSGFGITSPTIGPVPYKETLTVQVRAFGTAAQLNFGLGGEDASDLPAAVPVTYIEDTQYAISQGSTLPTPMFDIPVGRSAGTFVTAGAGSGSVFQRYGMKW